MEITSGPISGNGRLESLDVIRGLALLGILIMNIQSFALPLAAYSNPTAWGDFSGLNAWAWGLGHVFVESKFMSMFALLFGVGIALFCDRLEHKQQPVFKTHFRRMFWLAIFGLMHAYLIWWGDVLFFYALCGLLIYRARFSSPRRLWISGTIMISIAFLFIALTQASLPYMSETEWQEFTRDWQPEAAIMADEVAVMTGTWLEQFVWRIDMAIMMQTWGFLILILWQAGGLMMFGMALYKQGLFHGDMDSRTVLIRSVGFMVPGFALILAGLYYNSVNNWSAEVSMLGGSQFNYVGGTLVALGYVQLMVWVVQQGLFQHLRQGLSRIGRMAFSNYIAQSVICTFIFYGFGLGLFGQLERWQLLGVVFLVWAIQWIWSDWWLNRFRYGPLEWCWRRLTYWQPLQERRYPS